MTGLNFLEDKEFNVQLSFRELPSTHIQAPATSLEACAVHPEIRLTIEPCRSFRGII
jgi:hypothetical protein